MATLTTKVTHGQEVFRENKFYGFTYSLTVVSWDCYYGLMNTTSYMIVGDGMMSEKKLLKYMKKYNYYTTKKVGEV